MSALSAARPWSGMHALLSVKEWWDQLGIGISLILQFLMFKWSELAVRDLRSSSVQSGNIWNVWRGCCAYIGPKVGELPHQHFTRPYLCLLPICVPVPLEITVPPFNSCTKCVGSLGIIYDRKPDCHPVSSAWMHWLSQNWTQFWFASCAVHWLDFFLWHVIHGCLYNQTHWQSTGAGIKCLFITQQLFKNNFTIYLKKSTWYSFDQKFPSSIFLTMLLPERVW